MLEGNKLLVEKYGNGKDVVILVHGGPSLYGYMGTLGKELKDSFRVVDYAQSGTFESPLSEKVSIDTHIYDLLALVNKYFAKGKVFIIGHSWGANVALLAAARNSKNIDKLILIGTAALDESISDKHGDTLNDRYTDSVKKELESIEIELNKELSVDERNKVMQKKLALTSPFYHLDPETEKLIPESKWNFETFLQSIDSLWDLIDDGKIPSIIKDIKVPVVAYQGESDPIPYKDTFAYLSKHIPNIKTQMIEKSGHFPWLEPTSRDKFLSLLKEELKK